MQLLTAAPGVAGVEPVAVGSVAATPNDPKFADQWGLERIGAPLAWDRQTGSSLWRRLRWIPTVFAMSPDRLGTRSTLDGDREDIGDDCTGECGTVDATSLPGASAGHLSSPVVDSVWPPWRTRSE